MQPKTTAQSSRPPSWFRDRAQLKALAKVQPPKRRRRSKHCSGRSSSVTSRYRRQAVHVRSPSNFASVVVIMVAVNTIDDRKTPPQSADNVI